MTTFLTTLRALGAWLPSQAWQVQAMVAILLCSGMRVSELTGKPRQGIAPLPWSAVDLEAGVIRLESHKTANRIGTKIVYLCPELVKFMDRLPSEVLVLSDYRGMNDAWIRARKACGLAGLNLHDLRHTFASTGDDLGYSQATVGALVGHAAATQTGRYTHKLSKDLQTAAAAIGGHLWGVLGLP